MYIQDILSHWSEPTFMTLSLDDTNVFVCVLRVSWKDLSLRELWHIRNSGMRRSKLPHYDIHTALGDKLTWCLPALHALTGRDTTSNLAALKAICQKISLNCNFHSSALTESMMQMA